MKRRAFLCACALAPASLFAGRLESRLAPGFRPDAGGDEAGLWDLFDKEEKKLKRSKFLIRDPELNAYVSALACRVAGDHCRDMRVYLVRTPYFNANMSPNGMMQVWSGALLRCQNEAQLAAVIGHEIGHYLRRHGLDRFRDAKDKSALALLVGLGASFAGGLAYGALADGVIVASSFAYTRDHEREADAMGVELCSAAGYDPGEASKVWAHLIAERNARENKGFRDLVFATHPVEEEREEALREAAKGLDGCGDVSRQGRDRYHRALHAQRRGFFADELKLRDFGPSIALFERMLADDAADLEVAFYLGEVYRVRAREGDADKAMERFERLVSQPGAPVEAWRSIGLVEHARGNGQAASRAFRAYLERNPRADDAAMIRLYIEKGTLT